MIILSLWARKCVHVYMCACDLGTYLGRLGKQIVGDSGCQVNLRIQRDSKVKSRGNRNLAGVLLNTGVGGSLRILWF